MARKLIDKLASARDAIFDDRIAVPLTRMLCGGVYSKTSPASPADPTNRKLQALTQTVFRGTARAGSAAGGLYVLGERHDHAVRRDGRVHPGSRHDDPGWPRLLARRPNRGERQVLAPQAAPAA
jgi:hypothetical protein